MKKINLATTHKFRRFAAVLLLILLGLPSSPVQTVQAGNGATVDIPVSDIVPTLDGKCDPAEYGDAAQVTVKVGPSLSFPIFMKHTASDAYFCFGDNTTGLPLPAGGVTPSVALYIDRSDDGISIPNDSDDFGIWMSYDPLTPPWSNTWGTSNYTGADPGGWQAAKHQVVSPAFWQAEFKVSSLRMGGWNHKVGLALFYHWWQRENDDYSWPVNGIWANPGLWGNANLPNAKVTVGFSPTVPTVDGQCTEYSDASTISFTSPAGPVTGYMKHSLTDLYVCLANLAVPAVGLQGQPNAALYIDRTGIPGSAPTSDDLYFTISYTGTVLASSGNGSSFGGPDPGGYSIAMSPGAGVWSAEFKISSTTIGKWFARPIDLVAAEQNVVTAGDSFGWPSGNSPLIPSTWGQASLIDLGVQSYLPLLSK